MICVLDSIGFVYLFFLTTNITFNNYLVLADIYFPKLFLKGRYISTNYGDYQWEHTKNRFIDDGSLVKWYVHSQSKLLLAELVNEYPQQSDWKINLPLEMENCYSFLYNWTLLGEKCKLIDDGNLLVDNFHAIITFQCEPNHTTHILLTTMVGNCTLINLTNIDVSTNNIHNIGNISILFTLNNSTLPEKKYKPIVTIRKIAESTPFSFVIWIVDSPFYCILTIYQNYTHIITPWKIINYNFYNLEQTNNLTLVIPPKDLIAKKNTLIGLFEYGCVKYCDILNCTLLVSVYLDNCDIKHNSGLLMAPIHGNIVLRQTHYTSLALFSKTNTLFYRINFDIFCHMQYNLDKTHNTDNNSHVFDAWAKCGNFTVDNVVMETAMLNRDPTNYKPCKLSNDGNMLACLIFGEPYIFDIGDRQSAHPISSFDVSSWTLGSSIVKYGFTSLNSFYYELYKTEASSGMILEEIVEGLVFNIERYLQPSLMSSQVIYPTLATSITPSESYILVNHMNLDVWLFTHAGRIFYRNGSADRFEINLVYRDDMSFFISDYLHEFSNSSSHRSSLYYGHNYEHPFAFFSPDKTHMIYLSHFQVPSGSFSASAITIVDLYEEVTVVNANKKHSIIHVGYEPLLTQAGISPDNNLLYLVKQRNYANFLSLCIFEIDNIPTVTFNMSSMKTRIEISGLWSWSQYDSTESSKIWVIGTFNPNQLILSIHLLHNISTHIIEYKLSDNFNLELLRIVNIAKCIAISNFNDYITKKLVVLCSQSPLSNQNNQTYRIEIIDYITGGTHCSLLIDYKFRPLKVEFDRLKSTNIPGFDFDPTNHRLVVTCENIVYVYFTKTCPFQLLFTYKNHHIVSSAATLNINNQKLTYGITLLSYLQKIDIISDCTNGFGIASSDGSTGFYCTRCKPGYYGLGCLPCPAGFVCDGYAQLQPTSPCPEGYFCLEATGSNEIVILESSTDNEGNKTDIVYNFLKQPHRCPAGAYCPAGTAKPHINDTMNNSPQSCIEGYYCPEGSIKPTQMACPLHATSPLRSKSFLDCHCDNGYFGIAINDYYCIKCLTNGLCNHSTNSSSIISYMTIPEGYWPNYPNNVSEILQCHNSTLNSKTPCNSSICRLTCSNFNVVNITNIDRISTLNCSITCDTSCAIGHEGRLCSKCEYGYYKHGNGRCIKCSFSKSDTIYLLLPLVSLITVSLYIVIRKWRYKSNEQNKFLISDDSLLELLLTIIMLTFGFTTASTMIILLFFMAATYLENLDTPHYAKYIFIFYIQTLQALVGERFKWPYFFNLLFQFFNAFYATVPGISCLINPFTGKYIGWVGGVVASIYGPVIFGLILLGLCLSSDRLWDVFKLKKVLSFYCFTLFILQFPLSGLSLNTIACKYDNATNQWYMKSQPWQHCSIDNVVQISGIIGVFLYFIGYPAAINYFYWNKFFDRHFHKELEGLIVPSGTKCDLLFITFILMRGMILVVILILVPTEWDVQRLLTLLLFFTNIIIVIKRNPYYSPTLESIEKKYFNNFSNKYYYHSHEKYSQVYIKCILFLKKTHEGEFLEVTSLALIIFSYLLMDVDNNKSNLSIKSLIVGSLNFSFTIYFVFFVLLEHRVGLFHYIAYTVVTIYKYAHYLSKSWFNISNKPNA